MERACSVAWMEGKNMNILISVNESYFEAARVMLRSLFFNNKGSNITIYLFHSELDAKRLSMLQHLIEQNNGALSVIKIDDEVMKDVPVSALSKETYYRLMAPRLLPVSLNRILYLDIDTIVVGNLGKMYETDFQGKLFMAASDTSSGIEIVKKNLRMKKNSIYVNAGVLLMNLELLRQVFNLEDALEYAKKYPERVPNCDQDLINGLYTEHIGHLEWIYNYEARFHSITEVLTWPFQYRKLLEEIKIVHYMGAGKPWKARFCGKYLREYYRYARYTTYQYEIEQNMRNRFVNMAGFIWRKIIDKWKGLIVLYESFGLWNGNIL